MNGRLVIANRLNDFICKVRSTNTRTYEHGCIRPGNNNVIPEWVYLPTFVLRCHWNKIIYHTNQLKVRLLTWIKIATNIDINNNYKINIMIRLDVMSPLKRNCCHFYEIFVIDCIGSYQMATSRAAIENLAKIMIFLFQWPIVGCVEDLRSFCTLSFSQLPVHTGPLSAWLRPLATLSSQWSYPPHTNTQSNTVINAPRGGPDHYISFTSRHKAQSKPPNFLRLPMNKYPKWTPSSSELTVFNVAT